nr:unnamed protein product [Callosobruchus analis]
MESLKQQSQQNLLLIYGFPLWVELNWISPLAYYFTSEPVKASQLKSIIFECITKLKNIDLDVVVLNTKLRLNFLDLARLLGVGPESQTFKVRGQDVVFIFDPAHMMTVTRNNLMKHSLEIEGGGQTSWKHVKTLFNKQTKAGEWKTKLTDSHINPEKHERSLSILAREVLSNSVASTMQAYVESGQMPAEALVTAECISMFDRLFDMLNSTYEVSINEFANAYKATKRQKQFLEKVMRFLETLKVLNSKGKDKTSEVKFISAWLTTIRGVMKLWETVKDKGYNFLLTRNIRSEHLDVFINECRDKVVVVKDPTPKELHVKYLTVFVDFYFMFRIEAPPTLISINTYAKMIYKRIPAVRHNLGNTTQPRLNISPDEFISLVIADQLRRMWL